MDKASKEARAIRTKSSKETPEGKIDSKIVSKMRKLAKKQRRRAQREAEVKEREIEREKAHRGEELEDLRFAMQYRHHKLAPLFPREAKVFNIMERGRVPPSAFPAELTLEKYIDHPERPAIIRARFHTSSLLSDEANAIIWLLGFREYQGFEFHNRSVRYHYIRYFAMQRLGRDAELADLEKAHFVAIEEANSSAHTTKSFAARLEFSKMWKEEQKKPGGLQIPAITKSQGKVLSELLTAWLGRHNIDMRKLLDDNAEEIGRIDTEQWRGLSTFIAEMEHLVLGQPKGEPGTVIETDEMEPVQVDKTGMNMAECLPGDQQMDALAAQMRYVDLYEPSLNTTPPVEKVWAAFDRETGQIARRVSFKYSIPKSDIGAVSGGLVPLDPEED